MLRECLEKIRTAKRRAAPNTWTSRFAGIRNLQHRVAARLCSRGILRVEESKLLMVFKRKVYPEIDPVPEREIVDRLRDAVLSDAEVGPRTAILVSLANVTNLLRPILGGKPSTASGMADQEYAISDNRLVCFRSMLLIHGRAPHARAVMKVASIQ